MTRFNTLDLTEEETLISNMRLEGKSSRNIAELLGMTTTRVNRLVDRANRKRAAKERLKIQGDRKIRF